MNPESGSEISKSFLKIKPTIVSEILFFFNLFPITKSLLFLVIFFKIFFIYFNGCSPSASRVKIYPYFLFFKKLNPLINEPV